MESGFKLDRFKSCYICNQLIYPLEKRFYLTGSNKKVEHQAKTSTSQPVHLTPREREILQGILSGCTNKEIAAWLKLSVKTVEWHRMNMMKKMGVHKVTDLVRIAIQNKVV